MASNVGMKGKFTNHSARSSSINQLIHAGVPPQMVAQVSGHKDVSSVMQYAVASRTQQMGMSDILQSSVLNDQGPSPKRRRSVPTAALGRAPEHDETHESQLTLTQSHAERVFPDGTRDTVSSTVRVQNPAHTDMMRGIFAGATIHGNIIFNLKWKHSLFII